AQQGSIYCFLLLILAYVWLMNRADKRFEARKQEPGV
ncbi:MAG: sodium/substrate symporter small subunit, partial [Gammaproteobacteria bacterium]